jgi:hypothetical protein
MEEVGNANVGSSSLGFYPTGQNLQKFERFLPVPGFVPPSELRSLR